LGNFTISPSQWNSIDAIRTIGNIGAHMGKDINIIIEIEPDEAKLLVELIENLIEDWYITREERKRRNTKVTEKAQSVKEQRKEK